MRPIPLYRKRRRPVFQRIIAITILIVVGVVLGFLIALPPLIMGPMINEHVSFSKIYDASEFGLEATKLTLQTSDGYAISAFEVDVEDPKAVLIFISGIHNPSVTAFFGHARVLREHGYASILYDMRAHGQSEGELVSLGYAETRDTQAVVDYILAQGRYSGVPIVVYGVSMGGAVAINSIGQIPAIAGLVSLSAYSSWEDVFAENMLASGAPPFLTTMTKPFVKLYSLWKFGWETRDLYPAKQIANLGNRPALLIHSTEDSQVSYANLQRILEYAPRHVETWIRQGDEHMISTDFLYPENDPEYIGRVLDFLKQKFN